MALKYLLDTNALSEPSKQKPSRRFLKHARHHEGQLAMASTTYYEVLRGIESMPDGHARQSLRLHFADLDLPVLSFDQAAADWLAREAARLRKEGTTVHLLDGQIAAVAKSNVLTLVTANVKHFERFDGLKIENWLE